MKKLIIMLSIVFSLSLYTTTNAQNITVNVNLDKQPAWGPTGYNYAGYYYLPDLNVYYDINNALYYYQSGNNWTSGQYLPDRYRTSDFYSLYKVVVNDSQPWLKNKTHKKEYASYKGDKTQTPIRNSSDSKYNTSKKNSNSWVNTNSNQSKKNNNKQTDSKKNANNTNRNDKQTQNNKNGGSGNKEKSHNR